jgi:hypothetical protein
MVSANSNCNSSVQQKYFTGGAIQFNSLSGLQGCGGLVDANDRRDTVFASNDCPVRHHTA